ncbi:MAG TPA: XdhC family protein, partial [Chitinophagaceae bacterium]|nr:XdhC family protein [Chitinophagaceae bacterium]
MKEINDIIKSFDAASGKLTALATVVHVDGSSYRRPGARMLITEDGELTGAISGGCLEGDALRKALLVMKQGKAMLVTYDTNDEDDAKFGLGLGCNGIIQVLIEPINSSEKNNPINLLKAVIAHRKNGVVVTVFSMIDKNASQPGTCFLINDDGKTGSSPLIDEILTKHAETSLAEQQSSFKNYISEKESITAFIEFIKPAISLVIVGAGNDIKPMMLMARILGWNCQSVR